jgi:hypothetical protein
MEPSLAAAAEPSLVEAEAHGDVESPGEDKPEESGEEEGEVELVGGGILVRCAFCGCWCRFHGRSGPVRRRGPSSGLGRLPRLPGAGRGPPRPG